MEVQRLDIPEDSPDLSAERREINYSSTPRQLERSFISWIRAGISERDERDINGMNSQGGFVGMDLKVMVPIDLRAEFYDDMLKQLFLGLYNDITQTIDSADYDDPSQEIERRLLNSARRLINLIISIAGSSRRDRTQFGFEINTGAEGKNVLTMDDMVKLQIIFDQFGVMTTLPEGGTLLDIANEIATGESLSNATLETITNFRLEAMGRIDAYNASLSSAQNETAGIPLDVKSDARAYAGLLIMMNRQQMEQLIDYELGKLDSGADLEQTLNQVYMLAMNTDIAPGVVRRKLIQLSERGKYQNDENAQMLIAGTILQIERGKSILSARLYAVHQQFIDNLSVGDVQTFGRRGTVTNLIAILVGSLTAVLSGIKAATTPSQAEDHLFYLSAGLLAANYGFNRMRGGRGTEGVERIGQKILMSPDAIEDYGLDVIRLEAASFTALEVGFEITRDFYANNEIINLLRGMLAEGREGFTLEQFENRLRNSSNVSQQAREAYARYKSSTSEEYLHLALNFTAHAYKKFDIRDQGGYVREIGSRVGLEESDFVTT